MNIVTYHENRTSNEDQCPFISEKWYDLYSKMQQEMKLIEDMAESMESLDLCMNGFRLLRQSFDALEDCCRDCTSGIFEEFFDFITEDQVKRFMPSTWSDRNLNRWYRMFKFTGLLTRYEHRNARIFCQKIVEELIGRYPERVESDLSPERLN